MESTSGLLFYLVLLGAIFYFLIYRPQQKHRKSRQELLDSLEVGKNIVTIGGIHGTITKVDENTINLKIADNVEIKAQKAAVGYIVDEDKEEGDNKS